MSIITENKNYDEITYANGSQADTDGTVADSWTDGDTGTGVSDVGVTYDGKSCFKFDSGVAGSAIRTRDVGSFATPEWITIKTYFDDIGTLAASDYFAAVFNGASYRLSIRFCSDGLYVYDGAAWNEVGADIVAIDTWQEWTFKWTVAAAGVVDVYLNNVLVSGSVDCSDSTAGTNGTSTFTQIGTTKQCITYVDYIKIGAAQRSGGETWIVNEGAELTFRTDTRWHAYSPASYLGSLGSQTINWGKVIYDGTDVRWMAVNTASGDSPVGTTITQGGVTGIYLGFYTSKTAAPTTALSAATGFIKMLSVTGGAFSAGAITFGAGTGAANATSADVAGWIEIVADSASTITVARLGEHEIRGDWFYLEDATGAIAQQIQVPTNGGGAGTYAPGVWVERTLPRASTYTWAGDVVTVTLASHGYIIGQKIEIVFSTGAGTPNGEYVVTSVADTSTFAFALTGSGAGGNCTITSYEYWPSAAVAADGWDRAHIGGAYGETDRRQNFCKDVGGGVLQFGEAYNGAATYANVAAQASAYAILNHTSTYVVVSNVCTVTYATGHLLKTGQTVGIDFTSGGAAALDGTFAVTVIDAYTYSFALVTGDTSGACTVRPGLTITQATHGLGVGDIVYCDFTTGGATALDGDYTIYAVTGTGAYLISLPTAVTIASGNVSVYSRYAITLATHGLAIGNRVYLDFTTGSGVDGVYTIVAVPDANTFHIVANNNASADSGNVTVKMTIGNVPTANCRTRISNVILREAATASRQSNLVNATLASRPKWATSTAGAIDIENCYSSWYHIYAQAYAVHLKNVSYYNTMDISECATALDLDNVCSSNISTLAGYSLNLTSNFAGGTVQNCKFQRGGAPASSGHSVYLAYCIGTILDNVIAGTIGYARSSGYAISIAYGSNITVKNCITINGAINTTALITGTFMNNDHVDRYIGWTNATTARYGITIGAGSVSIMCDGLTLGFNGTIANNHPYSGLVTSTAGTTICFRNMGTFDNPLPCGNWRQNLYAMGVCFASGGNNYSLRCQRLYADDNMRTSPLSTTNSDKNVSHETVYGGMYTMSAMTPFLQLDTGLNSVIKGNKTGATSVSGQSSIYGTHFMDMFMGNTTGRYVLICNEPTADTASYFTMVAGVAKFNSAGGILMSNVNDQAVWEDQYYRKGHTAFQNTTPTMSGGTIGNYTLEYDIDVNDGTGFTGSYSTLSGANLSGETIDPSDGFKLKIRITTTAANLTAITYLRIDTVTSAAAQENNLYDLDVYTATLTGLQTGTKVAVLTTGTETLLDILTESSGSVSYTYPDSDVGDGVDFAILAAEYLYQKLENYTLTAANVSIPITQADDYGYNSAVSATVTFNGTTKRIICDAATATIDVVGVYTEWVDWALTSDNLKYLAAFSELGGNVIDSGAGTSVPVYGFLINNWRVAPDEADHTLAVTGGIILVSGGGDPFVDTTGDYTVRINYQQPVQAITVSTGGGGGASAADVWSYATRALTAGGVTAIQSGLATSAEISALNDISAADVWADTIAVGIKNNTGLIPALL